MKKIVLAVISGIVLLVLANLLAERFLAGLRWDLTENSLYTLSEGTKKILRNLDREVEITLYFSHEQTRDLPALRDYAKQVREVLSEYQSYAGDALKVKTVDPVPFSELEDEATLAGLQAIPVGLAGENIFFGIVARVVQDEPGEGAEQLAVEEEVVPFLRPEREEFLEYDLSRMIHNLAQTRQPVIGVLTGLEVQGGYDMAHQQSAPAWVFMQYLEELFSIQQLTYETDAIAADIDVLLLIHPKELPETTLLAIDQFALNGGRVLAFLDPVAEQDQPAMPMLADSHTRSSTLGPLLTAWGVEFDPERVVADLPSSLTVSVAGQRAPVRHISLLDLGHENWTGEDIILEGLEKIVVSTAGAFSAIDGADPQIQPLISTSKESGLLASDLFRQLANPETLLDEFTPDADRHHIAVRISGAASTAFPEGVIRAQDQNGEVSGEGSDETETSAERIIPAIQQTDSLNVILFADTDILSDRLWVQIQEFFGQRIVSPWADNGDMLANALENLSGGADLIGIRSRGRFSRPFNVVEEIRLEAEQAFSDQQRELQQRLAQTEAKLAELEQQKLAEGGSASLLTPEQEGELIAFQQEKLKIRKALRDVQLRLDRDIDALGAKLKLINIVLVPLVLTILVTFWVWYRRRRRRQALA